MYRIAIKSDLTLSSGRRHQYLQEFAFLCIVLLFTGTPKSGYAQTTPDEYQVKAAFLFHFAQFVDWPSGALTAGDPSLTLCIFKDEPRSMEFQSTIEGKALGTRVFHVRLISQLQDLQGCNILFLSRDQTRRQTAILQSLRGIGILTVGETPDFLSEGGMIRFHLVEGKIRFDINLEGAEAAHIKISSRLLLLATSVTRGHGSDRGR
jgi:hypothetical protein